MAVKIVEVCKDAPSLDSASNNSTPKSLPLNFYDLLRLRLPPVEHLFFYEILHTDIDHDNILPRLKLMPWQFNEPSDKVRGTFQLTPKNIEKLRHLMRVEMAKTNEKLHLSTGNKRQQDASVVSRGYLRPRLDPQVPSTYFGNCVGGRMVNIEIKGLVGKDGLVLAVKAIGEAIKSINGNEVLNGAEGSLLPFLLMSFWHTEKGRVNSIPEYMALRVRPGLRFTVLILDGEGQERWIGFSRI
ncbi:Chloramphenicol acetyltransferase-like domain containing protein [Parasponia andersonii]|uniref:Chloramphenicol acetyltransferase-like domain containing protein n=1 Tax=Parasponia andersonii TaxID=3476 RepID=A0A2P5CVV8_PARAD|nr:Chloramphenicol acetyltransferase-like domain containing protein [Parasponia andersonii]